MLQDDDIESPPGPIYINSETQTPLPDMDSILSDVQKFSGSLGDFLVTVFQHPPKGSKGKGPGRTQKQAQMVSKFLRGKSDIKAEDLVDLIYNHPDARPKEARSTAERPASAVNRPDPEPMARWRIQEWAVRLVESIVNKEFGTMASKEGGLHVPEKSSTWDFFGNFSLGNAMGTVQRLCPVSLRVFNAAVFAPQKAAEGPGEIPVRESYPEHFSKPARSGSGNNRRDPYVVSRSKDIYNSLSYLILWC